MAVVFKQHPEIAFPRRDLYGDDFLNPAHYGPQYRAVYRYNYQKIAERVATNYYDPDSKRRMYRTIVLNDLFFIGYFVKGNLLLNCPFGVKQAQLIEDGPKTKTLDVWARGHLKTFLIFQCEKTQDILKNPSDCHVLFSYKKGKAEDTLAAVKRTLESPFLLYCFPDVLYEDPVRDSPKWSVQDGLIVKGHTGSRKEKTFEAYGIIEGMPTGGHWDSLGYDDVETADIADSPDQLQNLIKKYEYSRNLRAPNARERHVGTYYHHNGFLTYIRDKKKINGEPMFLTRIFPATEDGTMNGKPVFLAQEELDDLKGDSTFNSQQLCNPTPQGDQALDFKWMKPIEPQFLPQNRIKFIIIDPAGDKDIRANNSNTHSNWSMICISVKTTMDDLGLSDVYLEDVISDEMGLDEAVDAGVNIYCRNGKIQLLGIEQTAGDTTYDHIRKGLKAAGRHITMLQGKKASYGDMVLLRPAGRNKTKKINSALTWPLKNGKLYYSTGIPKRYIDALETEFDKHPFYNVDILDCIAYLWDMLHDYDFDRHDAKPAKSVLSIMNNCPIKSDFC